jgi:TRAP-type C4-dicarboxylate transport system permease small subunit
VKSGGATALEAGFGTLIELLALVASVALLAMVAIICADVLTRNVAVPGMPRGVAWSNEISELLLYAITLLAAPWLLREGRHIRVDIVLRAVPARAAYACEWIADVLGLASCLWLVVYGASAALKSWQSAALSIKTLVMPEWWIFAPMPVCFLMVSIEFIFRMRQLALSERQPRADAVSAS